MFGSLKPQSFGASTASFDRRKAVSTTAWWAKTVGEGR
jgi:hypothetical protein